MNCNSTLISIIIPCYNSERFLSACILSLQNQSYINWEAICVNDGSTDNTERLLNEYSAKESRIRTYSQINQGAAKAREFGICKATGDYLTFLDADDTLTPNALQFVADKIKYNPDIIISGFHIVQNGQIGATTRVPFTVLDSLTYLKSVLCGKYGWELCAKVYKRKIFNNSIVTPQNIRIGEDAAVFIQLITNSTKIVGCNHTFYNYNQFSQSASHVQSVKYAEETLLAACFIESYLKQQPFYGQIRNEISAMFLLFYSNSTFKANLGKKHELVKYVFIHHFKLKAFLKIPIMKAIYIAMIYLTNGYLINIVRRVKYS